MTARRIALSCLAVLLAGLPAPPARTAPARGETPPLLLRNGTLVTVTHGTLPGHDILLREGKIDRIGRGLEAPEGAETIDLAGQWVLPGIVDTHSHIGVYPWPGVEANADGNEMTDPVTPQVRAMDSFDVGDPAIARALAGGVTTIQVLPGSANLIGGQTVVVKLKPGRTLEEMLLPGAPPGMKMATGENPKRVYGGRSQAPSTRMGNFAVLRDAFVRTRDYMHKWEEWERKPEKDRGAPPERNLRWEALVDVLRGKTRVHVHCYRADEILTLFRIAEEFGFRITSLQHALEAWKVGPEIARHGAGVATFSDWWGFKVEAWDAIPEGPAILHDAGVRVSIHSDSPDHIQRLPHEAAKSVAWGLPRDEAYRSFTLHPAWMLGLEDRIGSLDPGKDADLAVFSGDPLSVRSVNRMTIVDGEILYRREPSPELGGEFLAGAGAPREEIATGPAWITRDPRAQRHGSPAPDQVTVLAGGTVVPVSGPPIPGGVVVLRGDRIESVGRREEVGIPPGARVLDTTGSSVYPGFVDAWTGLGLVEIGMVEATVDQDDAGPTAPHLDVRDAYATGSELLPVARMGGVTSAVTAPGTGNVLGGAPGIFWLDGPPGIEGRTVAAPIGLVASFGEPPKGRYGPRNQMPSTRMGIAATLRAALVAAQDYGRKWEEFRRRRSAWDSTPPGARQPGEKEPERPESDLGKEALLPVLSGKIPLLARAERLDDILTAMRIAEEFGLRIVLVNATDAYRLAPLLAERRIPVLAGPVTVQPASMETRGAIYENAAILSRAGVEVALPTFSAHNVRNLRFNAGLAVAYGMDPDRALEAITLAPARIFGVEDRIGSIRPGLSADLVVLQGAAFEPLAQVRHVFIRGREIPLTSRQVELAGPLRGREPGDPQPIE